MDIKKERDAFEAIPRNARVLRGAKFKDGEYVALSLFDESSKELAAQLNYGWSIWQAAKAQANKQFEDFIDQAIEDSACADERRSLQVLLEDFQDNIEADKRQGQKRVSVNLEDL